MQVTMRGSDFFGVPFPVALADRLFRIYENEIGLTVDVIRWDPAAKDGVYEVQRGRTRDAEKENATGNFTFTRERDAFVYQFQPKPGVGNIMGAAPIDEKWTVRIEDSGQVKVQKSGQEIASLARNQYPGASIGIQVGADGRVATSVNQLPDGLEVVPAVS